MFKIFPPPHVSSKICFVILFILNTCYIYMLVCLVNECTLCYHFTNYSFILAAKVC